MKTILALTVLISSLYVGAQSPAKISYRKDFDEVKEMTFSRKLSFDNFKTQRQEFFEFFGEYYCKTTALPNEVSFLRTRGREFKLMRVVTISPYSDCKALPDFALLTEENRSRRYAQRIIMEYVDGAEKISVELYGFRRVTVRDLKRGQMYRGAVKSVF